LINETYIKVKGQWTYLYRAVDSEGNTTFTLVNQEIKRQQPRLFEKALGYLSLSRKIALLLGV
jgi:transposase-like protein